MQELIYLLIMTHITIMCVTLYLHRCQAHGSIKMSSWLSHPMRFWLWLTTAMVTKEWVAVHRRHHQKTDTAEDPHSPKIYGIWRVLFGGAFLYVKAKKDRGMVKSLEHGTPKDWIEENVYQKYNQLGIVFLLLFNILMFNKVGILLWLIQMVWIPFWAAGVVNGIGHWWGYRNTNTNDTSTNIVPFGVVIGGEELHNNHHQSPTSAKFSQKWYELDLGWFYIRLFEKLRLVAVR